MGATELKKNQNYCSGLHEEQFLIYNSSNSGDSKDGDGGDGGINDSFIISNSEAKSAYERTSSNVRLFDISVTTSVLFPRNH